MIGMTSQMNDVVDVHGIFLRNRFYNVPGR